MQHSISHVCKERNDEWSGTVLGRLEYARDLHAADAVYHLACSVNFCTGKLVPQKYGTDGNKNGPKRLRQGRPVDTVKTTAFLKVAQFLDENDEEQITIADLTKKIEEYLEDSEEHAYSAKYMKAKPQEHFGDKIVITTIKKRAHVVTFQRTATSIVNKFYSQPKSGKGENY